MTPAHVLVRPGLLDRAGLWAPRTRRVSLVADGTLVRLGVARRVARALRRAGVRQVDLLIVPPGERSKSVRRLESLARSLAVCRHERSDPIVVLGGGVACDLGGFLAATYMRGVPLVLLPTTLLAQVDAAIGGKTAVDLPEGKNLLGAFYPADRVVVDPEVLATLPEREFRAGLAEVVKAAVIADADLFARLEREAGRLDRAAATRLTPLLRRAIDIKLGIVRRDPTERTGVRSLLNYGHTVGHALEAAARFRRLHGEAVAAGMEAEGLVALRMGLWRASDWERQGRLLDALGLPRSFDGVSAREARPYLAVDKKSAGRRLRLALPVRIGEARFPFEPGARRLEEALSHATR